MQFFDFRAGKIRFCGARMFVFLDASSGERCASQNSVHLAIFRGTPVVHQMKYLKER